jgi:hypothetical protein
LVKGAIRRHGRDDSDAGHWSPAIARHGAPNRLRAPRRGRCLCLHSRDHHAQSSECSVHRADYRPSKHRPGFAHGREWHISLGLARTQTKGCYQKLSPFESTKIDTLMLVHRSARLGRRPTDLCFRRQLDPSRRVVAPLRQTRKGVQ